MPDPGPGRYAVAWVPGFAVAALLRQGPDLSPGSAQPLAVVVTGAATRLVVEASAAARAGGVRPGMSAAEAAARVPGLVCREQDVAAERAAAAALLDAAWTLSPRVEVASPGEVRVDLAGLPGAGGAGDGRLARRLAAATAAVGLPARVAIADTREAAALATRAHPGPVLVPARRTAAWLAPLPAAVLAPAPDLQVTLERWGLRTLGELAGLPRSALLARLGPPGAHLQRRARGEDLAPFIAHPPLETWSEGTALDWEIGALEALAFVLQRLLGRLGTRLALRDLAATALRLTLGLADGTTHQERLALPAPIRDARTLGALFRASLERRQLPAPVTALHLEAEVAPLAALQADLFAPPRPSPRELGEILGRLVALVGASAVGAPAVRDTHHPDGTGLAAFTPAPAPRGPAPARRRPGGSPVAPAGRRGPGPSARPAGARAILAARRLAPPLPATVRLGADGAPAHVESPGPRGAVRAMAGPWRSAGEWWADTAWDREEWDVALADGTVARLAHDLRTRAWAIEATYD